MAMALMIQEMNAANFSSAGAADGEVLTADGAGGAGWALPAGGSAPLRSEDPFGMMVVTGAGDAGANTTYTRLGEKEWSTGSKRIVWNSGMWMIWSPPFTTYYTSTEAVATPDMVTMWSGTAPAPVLTPQSSPLAQGMAPISDGIGGVTWSREQLLPEGNPAALGRVLKESYGYPEWSPLTVLRLNSVIGNGATPPTAAMINAAATAQLGRALWDNEPFLFANGYLNCVMLGFPHSSGIRAVAMVEIV